MQILSHIDPSRCFQCGRKQVLIPMDADASGPPPNVAPEHYAEQKRVEALYIKPKTVCAV
jgi:hypothetical protein